MLPNDATAAQPSLGCGKEEVVNSGREYKLTAMDAGIASFYERKKAQLEAIQEKGLIGDQEKLIQDWDRCKFSNLPSQCLVEIYNERISQLAPGRDTRDEPISRSPETEITKSVRTKSEAAKVQIQQISASLDLYHLEIGRYPTQEEGLVALIEAPPGLNKWKGPYLKKKEVIVDPWGRQFLYKVPGQHGPYDLYTFGSDGAQGCSGEDQDITNW